MVRSDGHDHHDHHGGHGEAPDDPERGEPRAELREFREPRDAAHEVVERLGEDLDAPSPVARRLREVLLGRLTGEDLGALVAFEQDPYAPESAGALEAALVRLLQEDPEFAARADALLRGTLGSDADEEWAQRYGGKPFSMLWIVIPLAIAWLIVSAIAAFTGSPPDIP